MCPTKDSLIKPRQLPTKHPTAIAFLSFLCLFAIAPAFCATIDVGSGNRVIIPLRSLKALRDENVVKQAFDYSCGAAALATLLSYGLEDRVSEMDIVKSLLTSLTNDEEILRKKQGFSLLDLQQVAKQRGHKAQGFKLSPKYLSKIKGPVIVFIEPRGYEHFAVLKGVRGDRIYLADPSLGNVRMPAYKFLDMWLGRKGKGIVFVVERKSGDWTDNYPLKLRVENLPQPEILTVRQMLEIGNPLARFPHLRR